MTYITCNREGIKRMICFICNEKVIQSIDFPMRCAFTNHLWCGSCYWKIHENKNNRTIK